MLGLLKSIFSSEEKERSEIVVHISELAQIWLKYNQSFVKPVISEVGNEKDVKEKEVQIESSEAKFFGQEAIREFYEPYRSLFDAQGVSDGFIAMLEFLDQYGSCPSVVNVREDTEVNELRNVVDILERVTLRDHSCNVARIMLQLLKETYRDYRNLIPMGLVLSFGHDIGKALKLRDGSGYAKSDHPILSEKKLREIFQGREPQWFSKAIEIIRNHHGKTKEQIGILLMKADSKAREMEIASFNSEWKVEEWNKWFDVKRFLEIILQEINVLKGQNKWDALSYGSYVYLQPDFVYESAKKLCEEKKIVDILLIKISSKEEAIKKVVEVLRSANLLSPDLGDTRWARKYLVKSQWLNKKMLLIPIRVDAFNILPHVLEERKEGYLKIIEKVVLDEKS